MISRICYRGQDRIHVAMERATRDGSEDGYLDLIKRLLDYSMGLKGPHEN